MSKERPPEQPDLHLDDFQEPPDDGISLDELSGSLASLLGQGDDPYETIEEGEAAAPAEPTPTVIDTPNKPVAIKPKPSKPTFDDAACPVSPQSIFESMLFVGHPEDIPLTSKTVASLMRGVRANEVDLFVEELNARYEEDGCPYFIESTGGGYRLSLRDEFNSVRERFYGKIREAKLSQAAIDVLAIVAYHQPIDRTEVDDLRGEESARVLNQLVRRELLAVERTDEKPRRNIFTTTSRFLDLFGMSSIDELPQTQDFDRR